MLVLVISLFFWTSLSFEFWKMVSPFFTIFDSDRSQHLEDELRDAVSTTLQPVDASWMSGDSVATAKLACVGTSAS